MILLDANILLRMSNGQDADYQRTLRVVFSYRKKELLAIASQTIYEFWAVATRAPGNNGLGMDASRASRWIRRYSRLFSVVADPPGLVQAWHQLVAKFDVRGFRAHDARYAALMQLLGMQTLMTYNVKHYVGFPITLIDPSQE